MRYVFLDCGSHLGESVKAFYETEQYLEKAEQWEIFCFEAHPELDNLIMLEKPYQVNFIPKAVWIKDGTIPFYLGKETNCDGSSLMEEKTTGELDKENPTIVHCLDFSQWLLTNFSSDDYIILKMDIEGAEYPVLEKMFTDNSLELVNKLYLELHAAKIQMDLEEEKSLLNKIKEKYTKLELFTENELNIQYPKEIRDSVPGFWFLGESRLVSSHNSQKLYFLQNKVDQLERELTDKIDKLDSRRKRDKDSLVISRKEEKDKIIRRLNELEEMFQNL